ncbi:MAG: polyprenyl diphosphate synthase [Candidatus Omnitrophota bacterium]
MNIPKHIAIIMDGNGRWAKKRGLPRTAGHRKGVQRIKEIMKEVKKIGVSALTIFAFSTENWNRPKKEVEFLFFYLKNFIKDNKKELVKEGIKFKAIGRRDRISKDVIGKIEDLENVTSGNKDFIFNIALDYGGRWDIVNAAQQIIKDYDSKKISRQDLDEKLFSRYLSLGSGLEPDFLIRTSGEQRISNFLIWNLAYSEFYFSPVFWPSFSKKELYKAVEVYSNRVRKFGGIYE